MDGMGYFSCFLTVGFASPLRTFVRMSEADNSHVSPAEIFCEAHFAFASAYAPVKTSFPDKPSRTITFPVLMFFLFEKPGDY
jgi:hypothetical protein